MSTLSETTASSRFNLRDRKKTDRKKKRPKRGSDTVGFKIYFTGKILYFLIIRYF